VSRRPCASPHTDRERSAPSRFRLRQRRHTPQAKPAPSKFRQRFRRPARQPKGAHLHPADRPSIRQPRPGPHPPAQPSPAPTPLRPGISGLPESLQPTIAEARSRNQPKAHQQQRNPPRLPRPAPQKGGHRRQCSGSRRRDLDRRLGAGSAAHSVGQLQYFEIFGAAATADIRPQHQLPHRDASATGTVRRARHREPPLLSPTRAPRFYEFDSGSSPYS
jgi:hypothetical protein